VRSFRFVVLAGAVAATVAAAAWGAPSRFRFTFDAPVSGLAVDRGSLWVSIAGDDLVLRLDLRTGRRLARIVLPRADRRAFGGGTLAAGLGRIWIAAPVRVTGDPSVGNASGWIGRLDPRSLRLRLVQVHGDRPAYVGSGGAGVWTSGGHTVRRVDAVTGKVTGRVHFGRYVGAVAVTRRAVWVAGSNTGELKKIGPRTLKVLTSVRVGRCAAGSSLAVVGGRAWAATDRGLVAIGAASGRVVARVALPYTGAIAYDGSRLWALARGGVYSISGGVVTKRLSLSSQVYGLLVAGGGQAWFTDEATNSLRRIPAG
jgi:hypothetical protein